MATREQYAQWIVANADKKGTPEFDTVAKAYAESSAASSGEKKAEAKQRTLGQEVGRQIGLTGRYALEGAGGALDFLASPIRGGLNMLGANIQPGGGNTLANALGLPKPETATERVVGEASRFAAGAAVPFSGANRLASGGQGTAQEIGRQLAQRPGAQLASAGASGGVDQLSGELGASDATRAGLALGAGMLTPLAMDRTQQASRAATDLASRVGAAREAGYVIPPTQARPTLANRMIEGTAGKITTGQNASARNQQVTNRLVAEELGLPPNSPITQETLAGLRRNAGQAYQAVEGAGQVVTTQAYNDALDSIVAPYRRAAQGFPAARQNPIIETIESLRTPNFDASAGIAQTRNLREQADSAFAGGDRGLARSLRQASDAIEDAIEAQLRQNGNPQLLDNFRNARRQIAQTYTAEKALANPNSGNIDARKLAKELAKNRPLTGGMRQAGEFAGNFPKAAQTPESMGSIPGMSPLDVAAAGGLSAMTGNPLMMGSIMARPAARSLALSPIIQNRLANPLLEATPLRNRLAIPTGALIGIQNDYDR